MSHITIVVGKLSRDPELRYLPNGNPVCTLNIPVTEKWGSGDQRQEKTTWYRVSAWGKQAEHCNTYLSKGSIVEVRGTVSARAYMKNGEPTASLDLRAERVNFIANFGRNQSGGNQGGRQNPSRPPNDNLDDIPF